MSRVLILDILFFPEGYSLWKANTVSIVNLKRTKSTCQIPSLNHENIIKQNLDFSNFTSTGLQITFRQAAGQTYLFNFATILCEIQHTNCNFFLWLPHCCSLKIAPSHDPEIQGDYEFQHKRVVILSANSYWHSL